MDVKELGKVVTVFSWREGGREIEIMNSCSVGLYLFDVRHGERVHLAKTREKGKIENDLPTWLYESCPLFNFFAFIFFFLF